MKKHLQILLLVVFVFTQSHAQIIRYCIPLDSISYYPSIVNKYLADNNNLIISGENHGVTEANDAKILNLFKYLIAHKKVTHLAWEAGPSFNWYFQRYLITGDPSLLNPLTRNKTLHTYSFFEALYKQHQTTPIQSIALDFDFWNNYNYPIQCLQYIDSLHPSSSVIMAHFRSVLDSVTHSPGNMRRLFLQGLLTQAKKDSAALKRILQNDYFSFTSILANLYHSMQVMDKPFFGIQRELYLTEQFQQQVVLSNIKAFAQFGDAHLPSTSLYKPFTKRISKINKTPIAIQPIHCLYINCLSAYGVFITYSHSTPYDPLHKNKELKARLMAEKGNWLLLIENDNHTKELIIVTSNFK